VELKRFNRKVCDRKQEQGPPIRKGRVEKADILDLILPKPCPISTSNKHYVDHHRTDLINRVSQVEPILDRLLERGIITTYAYSDKRMRELFDGPVKAYGPKGKDMFLDILMDLEPFLISDLKGEYWG
ncbi:unnamed protein product, partial [Coregonus sp. 'balchen']